MAQETLPHGIDWGKLEFRYNDSARTLAAFWGEFCITSVTAETLEERQHLLARLKKGVRRQHWNDAARPAGARASRILTRCSTTLRPPGRESLAVHMPTSAYSRRLLVH
jgi:hypothetical protein